MSSTEQTTEQAAEQHPVGTDLPQEHGALLPRLARQAIAHRLETGEPPPVASSLPESLTRPGAAFVSLYRGEGLRGCMGTLAPTRPLVESVVSTATDAAFNDPRFESVQQRSELDELTVTVSVLGEAELMAADSERELLEQLVPGEDGLILQDGHRRATFLPAVWASLPDPQDFLAQLKLKAGLMPDHWSPDIQFARYRSVTFTDPPPAG